MALSIVLSRDVDIGFREEALRASIYAGAVEGA
jgi:hypothetical protein